MDYDWMGQWNDGIPRDYVLPMPTHDSDMAKESRLVWGEHLGCCMRCGFSLFVFNYLQIHQHSIEGNMKFTALCHNCWELLEVPEARIEYYGMVINMWKDAGVIVPVDWERDLIREVANGG